MTLTAPVSRLSTYVASPFSLFQQIPDTISRLLICLSPVICTPLPSSKARWIHAHFRGHPHPRRDRHHREADRKSFHICHVFSTLIFFLLFFCFATQSLPFQKVQHKVTTRDAQPSSNNVASLIVSVTGLLLVSSGRKSPCACCTHHPPSRSMTARIHCSSPRCFNLFQRVGAITCTYILHHYWETDKSDPIVL